MIYITIETVKFKVVSSAKPNGKKSKNTNGNKDGKLLKISVTFVPIISVTDRRTEDPMRGLIFASYKTISL